MFISAKKLILANAARLVLLQIDIKKHAYGSHAWRQACELFQAQYDQLAFPGGLTKAFACLKQQDLTTIQRQQVQVILMQAIKAKYWLYPKYGRLACKVCDPAFVAQIEQLISSSIDAREIWWAKKILAAIK